MAIFQVHFYSKSLRREVPFTALLPVDRPEIPGNPLSERGEMKTLYLLNGYSGGSMEWLVHTRIKELADRLNLAVIMPSGENSFYVDDEEKGELFGEYVGRELVEFTRECFPLSRDRSATYIGGLSMGGYGAIRNGLKYPGQFGSVIALSSALLPYRIANAAPGYNDGVADYRYFKRVFGDLDALRGSDKDPEALVKHLKETGEAVPAIYMACGTEDFLLDVNRRFSTYLMEENVQHVYMESAGAHSWDFWNEYIDKALNWAVGQNTNP